MSKLPRTLATLVATIVTTELVFRLSRFEYGVGSVFSQPFDLVKFTVKATWWFGAWSLYWWAFGRLARGPAARRRDHEVT
jgi:hypothetical protein